MTTKTFKKRLTKIIEDSGEFVVDELILTTPKEVTNKMGLGNVIIVAGIDHKQVFTISIDKI